MDGRLDISLTSALLRSSHLFPFVFMLAQARYKHTASFCFGSGKEADQTVAFLLRPNDQQILQLPGPCLVYHIENKRLAI